MVFERYTERARQVIVLAQQEARAVRSSNIDGVHILLGLLAEEEGAAATALTNQGVTLEVARAAVERARASEGVPSSGQIPFTPEAKHVVESSVQEAVSLGFNYVGTEHILLAFLRSADDLGVTILEEAGTNIDSVTGEIHQLLNHKPPRQALRKKRDAGGGSKKRDVPEEEENEGVESIPTHQDRPTADDGLGRARLAEVLGERIRRVRGEDTETLPVTGKQRRAKRRQNAAASRRVGSFLVHIHAPWGAGKSSLLNFLGADLRNRRNRKPRDPHLSQWIVVEFSAWEHQRLAPPWWWLLAEVQRSCSRELWHLDRKRWASFWLRDIVWRLWNARAAWITGSLIALAVGIGWIFDWFGVNVSSLNALQAVLLTLASVAALATTLFGLASGAGHWLAIGSAAGADRFLRRAHDPLGVYRRRFRWLVRSCGYPIAVFIDDLDRCRSDYVVELLEGIQTLFTIEPVTYVVTADRTWLSQSFAKSYEDFEGAVGEPGRPLGFLFLEKTFQISIEIPPMSKRVREEYWSGLLRGGVARSKRESAHAVSRGDAGTFADARTQSDVEDRLGELIKAKRGGDEGDLAAAVRRLNAPDMQEQLEKLLVEFAPLLENNPRSMKRLMNAYGIERDRLLREGLLLKRSERRQLVLLTILRMRWPLLAEHLRRNPDDAVFCADRKKAPGDHPFLPLFDDPELRKLFDGSLVQEQLDPELLVTFPPA